MSHQATPAELKLVDEAFFRHRNALCDTDCCFCEDLRLSLEPRHQQEYLRLADAKAFQREVRVVSSKTRKPRKRRK